MYAKTDLGPGNIAALPSGIGLTQGPTISSNDPTSPQSSGGSHGAYSIPPVSGCCGMGKVHGHAPVPMKGLMGLLGLGECTENCRKWVWYGVGAVAVLFAVSWLHDKYKYSEGPLHY
jgi:hypothetical protein